MRQLNPFRRLLAPALLAIAMIAPSNVRADETGALMADAASRFLAALDDAGKAKAGFAFESPERLNWHWIPRERKGLPIKSLTPEQRSLAFGLVETGLSPRGNLKATTIMSLEGILRDAEHGTGPVRDPELYYLSVFGTPSESGEWGWRVEGHHLALNYTLRDGKVISATPFMFGSNPAEVKTGSRKGLKNLADIQAPAAALVRSLDPGQVKLAVIDSDVPDVTTTPNPAQAPKAIPKGIAGKDLTPDQKATLLKLVSAYSENFPAPIRDDLRAGLADGIDATSFAWYGPADPTQGHAFVIQGPTFLLDFNIKQDKANHIHTFYRSLRGDFGLPAAN